MRTLFGLRVSSFTTSLFSFCLHLKNVTESFYIHEQSDLEKRKKMCKVLISSFISTKPK